MSLTGLIDAGKGTPLWDWFNVYFSETHAFTTKLNRELRGGPTSTPCVVPRPDGSNAQLVGTAVGYMLSACLKEGSLRNTVASQGGTQIWAELQREGTAYDPEAMDGRVVLRIDAMRPWERVLDDDEWRELAGLCVLLARFEQVGRAPLQALAHQVPIWREHGMSREVLLHALSTAQDRQDVEALGRAAVEDHKDIRRAKRVELGPVFDQSGALGGADADVIYDGVLLDFKSGATPGLIGRNEAWQLLGYLFADTSDTYKIKRVGFSALRRRSTRTWDVQEYINTLAGSPTMGVEHWRKDFAELLAENRGRLLRRVRAPFGPGTGG